MKTYIVYLNGVEVGYIKAANHIQAEKKAWKKHKACFRDDESVWSKMANVWVNDTSPAVSVAYTEL